MLQQRGCVLSSFQSCVREIPAQRGDIFPGRELARHHQLAVKQGSREGTPFLTCSGKAPDDGRIQELLRVLCQAVTLNIHTMLFRPFGAGVPFDGFIADHDAAGRTAACGFKISIFDMDCLPQC